MRNLKAYVFITLALLFFTVVLGWKSNLFEIENNDFFQLYPTPKGIIKVLCTEDGHRSLSFFDAEGHLDEERDLPSRVFIIKGERKNEMWIIFEIGKTDLEMFLLWFNKTKSLPLKIGDCKISYSYRIITQAWSGDSPVLVDSLFLDKGTQKVFLYNEAKLISSGKIYNYLIYKNEIQILNERHKAFSPFILKSPLLISKFQNQVLSMYDDGN